MQLNDLKDYLGFAVAGNFAGHLGEAGEADEFSVIQTEEKDAPKGLFPFYIKGHNSFLSTYPISDKTISTHNREEQSLKAETYRGIISITLLFSKIKSQISPTSGSA